MHLQDVAVLPVSWGSGALWGKGGWPGRPALLVGDWVGFGDVGHIDPIFWAGDGSDSGILAKLTQYFDQGLGQIRENGLI